MSERYRRRSVDPEAARELGRACGVGAVAGQVLLHRGYHRPEDAREYLEAKLAGLTDPQSMLDRDAAAERLSAAISKNERIVVFGDYDVDGTTSAALLSTALEAMGGDVRVLCANRFLGGYGLSEAALERCLAQEPRVLVTCDCGTSDHARIEAATAAGVDVIVVDHHLVPEEPLEAVAFLNPHRPECAFPYKSMSSAGLAFSLAAAVRAQRDAPLDLRPWLDLVALGTVADMVPLDGDNRRLVRAGLRVLSTAGGRPGIRALKEIARLPERSPLSAWDISFRLGPRLNAPGRLDDPEVVLALLRARDLDGARRLAARIEALNNERKAICERMTQEAMAQVVRTVGPEPEQGLVVASDRWHRGVVGIVAARLVDRHHVPAVAIAIDDGIGHGSARAPEGVDVYAAIAAAEPILERFGGHHGAAGLAIEAGKIDELREIFAERTRGVASESALPVVDVEIDGGAFPLPGMDDIVQLEPTGLGAAAPLLGLADVEVLERTRIAGSHLKLRLRLGNRTLSAFGAGLGHRLEALPRRVQAVGTLHLDHYRGGVELSLLDVG